MYCGYCFEFELTVNRTAEPSFKHITGLVILFPAGIVIPVYSSLSNLNFLAAGFEVGRPEAERMSWLGL